MLDLFKNLIADFHVRGIQGRVIRRDLDIPLDANNKQEKKVLYFSEAHECDFLVLDKGAVTEAIQVCHDLTEDNRRRKLVGLQSAMARFGLKRGTLLTRRQKQELQTGAGRIRILPTWEWSLTKS